MVPVVMASPSVRVPPAPPGEPDHTPMIALSGVALLHATWLAPSSGVQKALVVFQAPVPPLAGVLCVGFQVRVAAWAAAPLKSAAIAAEARTACRFFLIARSCVSRNGLLNALGVRFVRRGRCERSTRGPAAQITLAQWTWLWANLPRISYN